MAEMAIEKKTEKTLDNIVGAWMVRREGDPQLSVEEFVLENYLRLHRDEPGTEEEKKETFRRRSEAWKKNTEEFLRYTGNFPEVPKLERWQAAEMLDNVISEFQMDRNEQLRYLANVKLQIYYWLLRLLDQESGSHFCRLFESRYEEEWKKAEGTVTEQELQELFSETVSLMSYAGIGYQDETRSVLANLGVGYEAEFHQEQAGEAERDFRFLASFLVSEMVLSDTGGQYTKEEQEVMVEQVVPVCVSSALMIQGGSGIVRVMRLAHSYLGRILTKKNMKLLAAVAVVLLAAKISVYLIALVIAGKTVEVGIRSLWNYCKNNPEELQEKYNNLRSAFSRFADSEWQEAGENPREAGENLQEAGENSREASEDSWEVGKNLQEADEDSWEADETLQEAGGEDSWKADETLQEAGSEGSWEAGEGADSLTPRYEENTEEEFDHV